MIKYLILIFILLPLKSIKAQDSPKSKAYRNQEYSIKVNCNNGKVSLSWQKPTGIKFEKIFIEKGDDTASLEVITEFTQETNKENEFNISDMNPLPKGAYYRLKLVKPDGTNLFGPVSYIKCKEVITKMQTGLIETMIYEDMIDITFVSVGAQQYTLVIYDGSGDIVHTHERTCRDGLNHIRLSKKNLYKGVYFSTITIEGKKLTGKFLID